MLGLVALHLCVHEVLPEHLVALLRECTLVISSLAWCVQSISAHVGIDQEKQFQICALALKLENLLLVDSKGSTVEHSRGDIVVDKPSQELLAKQPKNRLMTATEKVQRQVKRSNRLHPSM